MTLPNDRRYPPISDYGIIGDSRTCALVSRDGSIDWFCAPNFDSPSIFGRLVDWERGGFFKIAPAEPYQVHRRYIGDTNILETTFTCDGGVVALTDFMPALTEDEKTRALQPLRSLVRFVECRAGRVRMHLEYQPRPDYGRSSVRLQAHTPFELTSTQGAHALHLRSEVPLCLTVQSARGSFDVSAGERLRFSIAYSNGEPAVILSDAYVDWSYERTVAFWQDWSGRCTYDGRHKESVIRSALALKLLSYAPSGAILAAATTSLPEEIGGVRNWDYRYCWLRDASFTVDALLALGLREEAQAFAYWLLHATRQTAPRLSPIYTLMGEPDIPEHELSGFEGYRGSRPVRIGNAASGQHQFDVYGELIDALHGYVTSIGGPPRSDEGAFLRRLANYVARHWREPDSGIWEPRLAAQQYTHSKLMAWKALSQAADLARRGMIRGDAGGWEREADAVRQVILNRGFNARAGAFTQTLDGDALDASLLTLPLVGFLPGDDPRVLSTINAVQSRLSHNGFVRRYESDDGVEGREGAFVICNFWLAAALARAGRVDEAVRTFELTLKAQNDLLLMSEQTDPNTLDALGNFPQAFSHIGLITAALAISKAEGERAHP